MSKKIDFRKILAKNVNDEVVPFDISKDLGNLLYMRGMHIEEIELGHDIYHHGEVDLDENREEIVKRFMVNYPLFLRNAVEGTLANGNDGEQR